MAAARLRRVWASGWRSSIPREEGPRAERIVDAGSAVGGADRGGGSAARAGARPGAERGGADGRRHCSCSTRRRARPSALLLPDGFDAAAAGPGRGRSPPAARWGAPAAAGRRAGAGADARRRRSSPPAASGSGWPTSSSACWTRRSSSPPPKPRPISRHAGLPPLPQVRVVGVSGRGDRRLLDTIIPEISDLARVARGDAPGSPWRAIRWAAWSPTGASGPAR